MKRGVGKRSSVYGSYLLAVRQGLLAVMLQMPCYETSLSTAMAFAVQLAPGPMMMRARKPDTRLYAQQELV